MADEPERSSTPPERPRGPGRAALRRDDEISLLEVLVVLARHKRLVFVFPFACAVIAALISLALPNIYTGTAQILPPQQGGSPLASALLGDLGGLNVGGSVGSALGLKNPSDLYVRHAAEPHHRRRNDSALQSAKAVRQGHASRNEKEACRAFQYHRGPERHHQHRSRRRGPEARCGNGERLRGGARPAHAEGRRHHRQPPACVPGKATAPGQGPACRRRGRAAHHAARRPGSSA